MATSEARARATAKYHARHRRVLLLLDPAEDADIIAWLDGQPNMTKAVKVAIRRQLPTKTDME